MEGRRREMRIGWKNERDFNEYGRKKEDNKGIKTYITNQGTFHGIFSWK
jgi:hypothetical protein